MTPIRRLMSIRTGGATERCHGVRHQGSYSVAAHTWGALALLWMMWPDDFPRLAEVLMFHDVPEGWVGDLPAPVKRYNPEVKQACDEMEDWIMGLLGLPTDVDLGDEDKQKLRACDHLELYLWACEQVHGGNRHASCVVRELERYFEETPLPPPAHALYLEVRRGSVEHATDRLIMEMQDDIKR